MLSDAASLANLATAAPWLAVSLLSLLLSAWVFRQSRRAVAAVDTRTQLSNVRQGKRLGELEQRCGLLDLRRKQVEWQLLDLGVALPPWPPDGPDQPRPRPRPYRRDDEEDLAEELPPPDEDASPTAFRPTVPPLPDMPRHRRSAAL